MPHVEGVRTGDEEVLLYVEDVGAGPAIVLLHPWPFDSQIWELQVAFLVESGFRVVTYDRRGFGRSTRPWSGYDYSTLAGDLHAVVTQRGLGTFSLVGASLGGGEVVQYLKEFGDDRVRSVVLASAILPAIVASTTNPEGGMSPLVYDDYLSSARNYRLAFLDQFLTSAFSVRGELVIDDLSREHALRAAEDSYPRAIVECLRTWASADLRAVLATVTVPTLVLHASDDAIFPVETAGARTHRALASGHLEIVPNAPHAMQLTHAAQFNRAIVSFLRRPQ